MLKAFGAFLLLFWLLSLLVHANGLGHVFGWSALALFAMDILLSYFGGNPRSSKVPGEPLL